MSFQNTSAYHAALFTSKSELQSEPKVVQDPSGPSVDSPELDPEVLRPLLAPVEMCGEREL